MSTSARTTSGDLQLPRVILVDPASVALQTIVDILSLWQGEWFLDTGGGFPWLQRVMGSKSPNVGEIQALLRKAILAAPYVISVDATAIFDSSRRAFSYTFEAFLNTNQTITGGSAQAFQVNDPGGQTT